MGDNGNVICRCRRWMAFCNNRRLHSKDIRNLHKQYQVCSKHFADNMFVSSLRLRLDKTAVPILKGPNSFVENVDLGSVPGPSCDGN